MKKISLVLCMILSGVFLTVQPIAAAGSFSNAALVVRVVDKSGKPVSNICGMLSLGVPDNGDDPPSTALSGNGPEQVCTGKDGNLYFTDGADMLPKKGILTLYARHNDSMNQDILLDFAANSSRHVTITWVKGTPPSQAPDPKESRFTFRIVDENGNPVEGIGGYLENTAVGFKNLQGTDLNSYASSEDGRLYADMGADWAKNVKTREYTLSLYGRYDDSLKQSHKMVLPDPPKSYVITWKQPLPAPQSTGIRIFLVDTKGNPVEGVTLAMTLTDNSEMGIGPSNKYGYIRWDKAKPGTYTLYGEDYQSGNYQSFEIKMPKNKTMIDVTLTWNP